jgi:hypothetical protein
MKTAILFWKKDFAHSKPWLIGAWFAFALGNLLPWVLPDRGIDVPSFAFGWMIPTVVIYLTCIRIIGSDPFVGSNGFIGTRPVLARHLLGYKLSFIVLALFLPAMAFAFLTPALLRIHLSWSDGLLFFIERSIDFWDAAAVAVLVAVVTRRIGAIALASVIFVVLIGLLIREFSTRDFAFSALSEDMHLWTSALLAARTLLPLAALATAMTWVASRRIWQTVVIFLTCAALLASLKGVWKWNFVDALSKAVNESQVVVEKPGLLWLDRPWFGSNNSRDGIRYSQVTRSGRVTGLKDGWLGTLEKFVSEARLKNGTVWKSSGAGSSDLFSFVESHGSSFLPRLGIDLSEKGASVIQGNPVGWTLFECEKSRLAKITDYRASIRGIGRFKLYQPYIVADFPAKAGATAVAGRFRLQIESLSIVDGQITTRLGVRGLPLKSRGDGVGLEYRLELLFGNRVTQEFGRLLNGNGGADLGSERSHLDQQLLLENRDGPVKNPDIPRFLKDARIYIIGTRYGGTLSLPYEIPEMVLEEKR